MRTQEEIVAQVKALQKTDLLGFEYGVLLDAIDLEHARPLLKPDAKVEGWERTLVTDADVYQEAEKYMEFAIGKALGHRGISAGRSVAHYRGYFWLMGETVLVDFIDDPANYPNYGAPILLHICHAYGWQKQMFAHEVFNRMARGLPCVEDCEEGCGRG